MPPRGSDARRLVPLEGGKVDGHPERGLAELAFRQWGVVNRTQLLEIGLTSRQIDGRVERGALHRIHRGVYAVGHPRLSRDGLLLAAVFGAGRGAVVSHRDAAGLYGIRPANHRDVELTLPRPRRPLTGVRLHRAALPPSEVTEIHGIPVTTLARTLVDLAGTVPEDHLRRALHEAERVHRNDVREIERIMERTRTRNGTGHATLRAALADARAYGPRRTRSDLEEIFYGLTERFGIPRPGMNVVVHGCEVDAWWAEERIAVEIDGWQSHGTRKAFQRDREKGNHLALHGIVLLRFTYRDVMRRPERVAREVVAALSRGRGAAVSG